MSIYIGNTLISGGSNISSDKKPDLKEIADKIMEGNKRIKFIGDSITDGAGGSNYNGLLNIYQSVNNKGYCYANLFKRFLTERYNCTCVNRGMYGSVLSQQFNSIGGLIDDDDDIVFWLTGTNNRNSQNLFEAYRDNFENSLNTIINNYPNTQILVINNIPSNDSYENTTNFTMQGIGEIVLKACRKLKVKHIDLYTLFSYYLNDNNIELQSCLSDSVHPNDLGYNIMFRLIAKEIGLILDGKQTYKYDDYWVKNKTLVNASIPSSLTIGVGEITSILAIPNPLYSVISSTSWEVNNSNVEITDNGMSCSVIGKVIGSSNITFKINGKPYNCNVTVQSSSTSKYPISSNLVSYWKYDNYSDLNLLDISSNKYNLEMRGNILFKDKLYFDGNGFGTTNTTPTEILTYEFTVEFDKNRTRPSGINESAIISTIGDSTGIAIVIKDNFYPYLYYNNGTRPTEAIVSGNRRLFYDSSVDTKVNYVFRYNETSGCFEVFKNGSKIELTFSVDKQYLTSDKIGIGLKSNNTLISSLDRVSIYSILTYSRSLTDEEIIYNCNLSI